MPPRRRGERDANKVIFWEGYMMYVIVETAALSCSCSRIVNMYYLEFCDELHFCDELDLTPNLILFKHLLTRESELWGGKC